MAVTNYYQSQQRDQMIEGNLEIVKYQALRLKSRLPAHVELDDLISYGIVGLLDAVDKFDTSRGVKFKTYAELRVRGAILDGLRELDWVPRSYRRKQRDMEQALRKLENELGRSAEDDELADAMGLELDDFYQLLDSLNGVNIGSIEATDPDSEDSPLQYIADSEENSPAYIVAKMEMRDILADSIQNLPEKEQLVLSLYYFEGLTMKEVGRVLDITESRVSQLHSKAVMRMRVRLQDAFIED